MERILAEKLKPVWFHNQAFQNPLGMHIPSGYRSWLNKEYQNAIFKPRTISGSNGIGV